MELHRGAGVGSEQGVRVFLAKRTAWGVRGCPSAPSRPLTPYAHQGIFSVQNMLLSLNLFVLQEDSQALVQPLWIQRLTPSCRTHLPPSLRLRFLPGK